MNQSYFLYSQYQAQKSWLSRVQAASGFMSSVLSSPWLRAINNIHSVRAMRSSLDVFSNLKFTHSRPDYDITQVTINNEIIAVSGIEEMVTPFANLLHFKKDINIEQPKVLLVTPMSGHFSTLARRTITTMLPDMDVYVTDWNSARDIPLSAGKFDLDDYVTHVINFMQKIDEPIHLVAICQACVPVMMVSAITAHNSLQPRSMTLLAGPIDPRINPGALDLLALKHSCEHLREKVITCVPAPHKGQGRMVFPGIIQISGFIQKNLGFHFSKQVDLYHDIYAEKTEAAEKSREFYREFFAVSDLTAEFYLQTVKSIFQDFDLAKNQITYLGNKLDMAVIDQTAMLTIEGENDDICPIGQTKAAHELCSSLTNKSHYLQKGAGHYGVFSSSHWHNEVYPVVKAMIINNN